MALLPEGFSTRPMTLDDIERLKNGLLFKKGGRFSSNLVKRN